MRHSLPFGASRCSLTTSDRTRRPEAAPLRNETSMPPQATRSDPGTRNLARAFAVLACATYALIVLGALVRAHGAGLACPDWPLCFGEFVPRFDLKVAFEWGHRVSASAVSLGFVSLSFLAWRNAERRRAAGARLFLIATALLTLQVILGALTVWKLLAFWSVTSHLLTGNAFAACLVLIAARLFDASSQRTPPAHTSGLRNAVTLASVLLVFQVALGGLVASRDAGLVCQEWASCNDGQWFPSFEGALGLQITHRLTAYALVVAIATCALLGRGPTRLGRLLNTACLLVVAQIAVGVANVLLRLPVEVTGAHSALAAGLIAIMTLALREVWGDRRSASSNQDRDRSTGRHSDPIRTVDTTALEPN
jgi:cytochrome c oxidase assembly protein subunit 15